MDSFRPFSPIFEDDYYPEEPPFRPSSPQCNCNDEAHWIVEWEDGSTRKYKSLRLLVDYLNIEYGHTITIFNMRSIVANMLKGNNLSDRRKDRFKKCGIQLIERITKPGKQSIKII